VYRSFCSTVNRNEDGVLFLDAPGETGKTFLIKLILAKISSEVKIALATASSGIVTTLLSGGRIFKTPPDLIAMDRYVVLREELLSTKSSRKLRPLLLMRLQ